MSNPFRTKRNAVEMGEVTACRACPRLVAWREAQASRVPRRHREAVRMHGFWARPVPAFGDPKAWLAVVGLAPAAQGGNRTGRMFTGDRSGDFLFAALHRAGLANQPSSEHRGDGLTLRGALVTAAARCAPPGNRPLKDELERCRGYLALDLCGLVNLRVVLALGAVAHHAVFEVLREGVNVPPDPCRFRHGREFRLEGGVWCVDSYHVSQQNTFTGRLTAEMFDAVLERCRSLAEV